MNRKIIGSLIQFFTRNNSLHVFVQNDQKSSMKYGREVAKVIIMDLQFSNSNQISKLMRILSKSFNDTPWKRLLIALAIVPNGRISHCIKMHINELTETDN